MLESRSHRILQVQGCHRTGQSLAKRLSLLLHTHTHAHTILSSMLELLNGFFKIRFSPSVQNILITGASNGLGRQLAVRLSTKGATLVLWSRDEKELRITKELCEQNGATVCTRH